MRKPEAPCKGCEFKYDGCHSECEIYQIFKIERDEYNEMVREGRRRSFEQDSLEIRRVELAKKGVRRRRK